MWWTYTHDAVVSLSLGEGRAAKARTSVSVQGPAERVVIMNHLENMANPLVAFGNHFWTPKLKIVLNICSIRDIWLDSSQTDVQIDSTDKEPDDPEGNTKKLKWNEYTRHTVSAQCLDCPKHEVTKNGFISVSVANRWLVPLVKVGVKCMYLRIQVTLLLCKNTKANAHVSY